MRTARIIGHEARCAGGCVILCGGRFGWDLPMQRLFLSRNIEGATARVRRGRPAWLLLLHSPDSSDAARWRGAWCDQDPRWSEAEASEVHTLREEVKLSVGSCCFDWDSPMPRLFLSRNIEGEDGAPGNGTCSPPRRRARRGVRACAAAAGRLRLAEHHGEPAASILEPVHID